jgi:hypothetical protein
MLLNCYNLVEPKQQEGPEQFNQMNQDAAINKLKAKEIHMCAHAHTRTKRNNREIGRSPGEMVPP